MTHPDPQSVVERKLQSHGVKPTAQRVEIGMLLLLQPCHMSAEQILVRLHETGVKVSKATVYNTLNLFSQQGIVREVAVDPNHLVYDSTVNSHHHFYNADTGELTDIEPNQLEISRMPNSPAGTQTESIELIVRVRNKD
jgi:Fur family iron response transcriptional regulator